jgi:hypothetical protein
MTDFTISLRFIQGILVWVNKQLQGATINEIRDEVVAAICLQNSRGT